MMSCHCLLCINQNSIMDIQYRVKMLSQWHCGSGQSAGAELDLLVIKDKQKMPYIPGKTMKGLIRDAVEELMGWMGIAEVANDSDFALLFGNFDDSTESMAKAEGFFTDAVIEKTEYDTIVHGKLQQYLYDSVDSTAIDNDGIAKDASLRTIEVCVPVTLVGSINNVPQSMRPWIKDAMGYIKCLGTNRSRGLGRCTIEMTEKGDNA